MLLLETEESSMDPLDDDLREISPDTDKPSDMSAHDHDNHGSE